MLGETLIYARRSYALCLAMFMMAFTVPGILLGSAGNKRPQVAHGDTKAALEWQKHAVVRLEL